MLWKVFIDNDGVCAQQLAIESPALPTFPTELNNSEGHAEVDFF